MIPVDDASIVVLLPFCQNRLLSMLISPLINFWCASFVPLSLSWISITLFFICVTIELEIVPAVPARINQPIGLEAAAPGPAPMCVQLYTVGFEYGVRSSGVEPSNSPPASAISARWIENQNCPLPVYTSSQSYESSSQNATTACFRFGAPPKNSMPSSELAYTSMYSSVVPLPTAPRESPLSSLPLTIWRPPWRMETYFNTPE